MRLHRLSVRAFGPFADTAQVDFDALSDAGLFLLGGPTGAGKTCILDAVCFALYGHVPGARGTKALKSQHAEAGQTPEVVLDFGIGARRFAVHRTPEWTRRKRSGSGLRVMHATASLTETTDGQDRLVSSRAQEVGHEIADLMGMTASQFTQVAMLPQGEFQRFLRASSQERHDVLQQLFRTERFSRIEEWVHDHSRDLRRRADERQRAVQRLLDALADRCELTLPEPYDAAGLGTAHPDQVVGWARDRLADVARRLEAARKEHDDASAAFDAARVAHAETSRIAELVDRRDRAHADLLRLDEQSGEMEQAVAALDADARARVCAPLIAVCDETREAVQTLSARRQGACADLDAIDEVELQALRDDLGERVAALRAVLPRERAGQEAEQAREAVELEHATLTASLRELERQRAELPERLARARDRLATARVDASRRDAVLSALAAARDRHRAAAAVPPQRAQVDRLRHARQNARDVAADAREALHEVVARRLAGIAAELASALDDGRPCPVCGSEDHPEPATPSTDAVSDAEQTAANEHYDRARAALEAATRRHTDAETKLAELMTAAGHTDEAASLAEMEALSAELAAAETATAGLEATAAEIETLAAQCADADRKMVEVGAELARTSESMARHADAACRAADEVAQAALGLPDRPLADLISDLSARREVVQRALTSSEELAAAHQAHDEAASRAARLAGRQGFSGTDSARAAVLDPERRQPLQETVQAHANATARARAVLDDPEVAGACAEQAAGLADAEHAVAEADDRLDTSRRAMLRQGQGAEAVASLCERLEAAVDLWAPIRDRAVATEAMAKLVRGMGHENALQMRLSAYALAARLDQVVDAANERLAHMRDQRYLLRRTGQAARRNAQAGLDLEVLDQWTGETRAPSTLSGGETFVVSLALALGLADVVGQEAGGAQIDTLFVDEGFGSLDADTLDDVMDRLDALRAGGRTVGVVSHVTELRNRIPTQVQVDKGRSGSTVSVRTLAC
jgi:exonuclease SbcC